jgi:hypothetical protein
MLMHSLAAAPSSGAPWCGGRWTLVRLFARGTHALAAAVDAVRATAGAASVELWLPGYFCNPALSLVRRLPVSLHFYPVTDDLGPDWERIQVSGSGAGQPRVFLLAHYFGFPAPGEQARAFCAIHGMVLLEDAAHVLVPDSVPAWGDMRIFSPHKVLAVPPVGILTSSPEWAAGLPSAPPEPCWRPTLRWLATRLPQAAALRLRLPTHRNRMRGEALEAVNPLTPGSNSPEPPPPERGPLGMANPLVLRMLATMERDVAAFAERRRDHYQRLARRVADLPGAGPLFPTLPEGVYPMALPLVASGGRSLARRIQEAGIRTGQWWDVPPEIANDPGPHRVALRFYDQLVFVPVHQGLSSRDVDEIGDRIAAAALGQPDAACRRPA